MRRAEERRTWQAMRRLVVDRNDRKREVCEALELSFVRVQALRRVATGPMPMRDLAAALHQDPSYTTLVVDDLESRGLVERTPHPDDRRAKIVTVTAEGRRQARRAETLLSTPPKAMRRLSDAELTELDRLLAILLAE